MNDFVVIVVADSTGKYIFIVAVVVFFHIKSS